MYAEIDDLKSRLGEIYEAIYTADVDAEADLADANAEVDGCLGKRYRIPVEAPAALPLLKGWTLTLCEERSYSRAAGSAFAEKVASRVAQVRKYLESVQLGTFQLPGAAENISSDSTISLIAKEPPLFTREDLKGY